MKIKRICAVAALFVLLIAIGLQARSGFVEAAIAKPPHLSGIVPVKLAGWSVEGVPLGPTESIAGSAAKKLNYDDYVYRSYSKGSVRFSIYAAYWGRGKMPTRLVASHTPDRCWTENGMSCMEIKFKMPFQVGAMKFIPVEWRLFATPSKEKIHVLYWHVVQGKLYDYGARFNAMPQPWLWWTDMLAQATGCSREQYFVRITGNVPFEELKQEAGFSEAVSQVSRLGIDLHP